MSVWCDTARCVRVAGLVAGGYVMLAALASRGGAPADDAPAPTAAQATPAGPAAAKPAAEPDKATLEQWRTQIDKWKKIDPREAADNSFCYVCHVNYQREKLVKVHEPDGIGCETCHGMSEKHSQDEDSLVPPDLIFARAHVAQFCVQCHDKRDLIDSDESHEKFFAGQLEPDRTCTGCHEMKHTLKVRTRRWNKETRKIEWYDGVRMMQQQEEKQPAAAETDGTKSKQDLREP